ncbi:MAG: glycosyltransferase [Bacilli bacterium]|nr:glycosyltransferase [Bacilli bacterium]
MKKLVFGITSLQLGGAERVLVDLVNVLSKKYDVTIFTLYGKGEFINQLNPNVSLISMHKNSYNKLPFYKKICMSIKMIFPFFRKQIYNKYINNKYDVVISFLEGPITWIFSHSLNDLKIAWVHNDIVDTFGTGLKARRKKKLNEKCYTKYDKIIFVSHDNLEKFKNTFINNTVEKRIIYNYLNVDSIVKKSNEFIPTEIKHDKISFLQVSRLVEQKGLDRLLEVHKKLIDEKKIHYIYIIGEGPLHKSLSDKIKQWKLEDTFILLGKKENPYPYIKNIDNFILTSRFEGYGMVVVEAKILNKAIMITDTAAREALDNYENGIIVSNDFDGIYNGLNSFINGNINKNLNVKFDNYSIINDIIDLIEGV